MRDTWRSNVCRISQGMPCIYYCDRYVFFKGKHHFRVRPPALRISMNTRVAKSKAKNDMALNLSELAAVSGYGRSSLQAMKLPLIHGKISLKDFRRVLRHRQDGLEEQIATLTITNNETGARSTSFTRVSSFPATDYSMPAAVDKFRAPRSSNGPPSASPSPAAHPARNNG
jgi:hypothetical protein